MTFMVLSVILINVFYVVLRYIKKCFVMFFKKSLTVYCAYGILCNVENKEEYPLSPEHYR